MSSPETMEEHLEESHRAFALLTQALTNAVKAHVSLAKATPSTIPLARDWMIETRYNVRLITEALDDLELNLDAIERGLR